MNNTYVHKVLNVFVFIYNIDAMDSFESNINNNYIKSLQPFVNIAKQIINNLHNTKELVNYDLDRAGLPINKDILTEELSLYYNKLQSLINATPPILDIAADTISKIGKKVNKKTEHLEADKLVEQMVLNILSCNTTDYINILQNFLNTYDPAHCIFRACYVVKYIDLLFRYLHTNYQVKYKELEQERVVKRVNIWADLDLKYQQLPGYDLSNNIEKATKRSSFRTYYQNFINSQEELLVYQMQLTPAEYNSFMNIYNKEEDIKKSAIYRKAYWSLLKACDHFKKTLINGKIIWSLMDNYFNNVQTIELAGQKLTSLYGLTDAVLNIFQDLYSNKPGHLFEYSKKKLSQIKFLLNQAQAKYDKNLSQSLFVYVELATNFFHTHLGIDECKNKYNLELAMNTLYLSSKQYGGWLVTKTKFKEELEKAKITTSDVQEKAKIEKDLSTGDPLITLLHSWTINPNNLLYVANWQSFFNGNRLKIKESLPLIQRILDLRFIAALKKLQSGEYSSTTNQYAATLMDMYGMVSYSITKHLADDYLREILFSQSVAERMLFNLITPLTSYLRVESNRYTNTISEIEKFWEFGILYPISNVDLQGLTKRERRSISLGNEANIVSVDNGVYLRFDSKRQMTMLQGFGKKVYKVRDSELPPRILRENALHN